MTGQTGLSALAVAAVMAVSSAGAVRADDAASSETDGPLRGSALALCDGSAAPRFDLSAWRGEAPFAEARERARGELSRAPEGAPRAQARLRLARLYFSEGLLAETLAVLTADDNAGSPRGAALLRAAAHAALHGDHQELTRLRGAPHRDACLWTVAARVQSSGAAGISQAAFASAAARLLQYPQWARSALTYPFGAALVEAGHLSIARILLEEEGKRREESSDAPDLALLRARIAETLDDIDQAADAYTIAATADGPIAAEAGLRRIALLWRHGRIEAPGAAAALRDLAADHRRAPMEPEILLALARANEYAARPDMALGALGRLMGRSPGASFAEEAQDRFDRIFVDLFENGRYPNIDSAIKIELYLRYRDALSPEVAESWMGDLAFAEQLAEAGAPT
ncbi:MAG: hypothetical protein AAGH48_04395, partial [Pseudomonadota bacterium]